MVTGVIWVFDDFSSSAFTAIKAKAYTWHMNELNGSIVSTLVVVRVWRAWRKRSVTSDRSARTGRPLDWGRGAISHRRREAQKTKSSRPTSRSLLKDRCYHELFACYNEECILLQNQWIFFFFLFIYLYSFLAFSKILFNVHF